MIATKAENTVGEDINLIKNCFQRLSARRFLVFSCLSILTPRPLASIPPKPML
jgi:hypothetical protein